VQDVGVDHELLIQGRRLKRSDVDWLREWIEAHPDWSRKRLAKELCGHWQWVDGHGRLKDFAARSLLLKLEARGELKLPMLRVHQRRPRPTVQGLACWEEPSAWRAVLGEIQPVQIELIQAGSPEAKRWAFYLDRYHYLSLRVVGENLGYLVGDRHGRDVSCVLFGAAAWRCAARDRHLGWNGAQRTEGLARVANNTRFLVLPWVRVPHLASHILGAVARRIDGDWQNRYGHGLDWLESFVDRERFRGSCYRAANWQWVGQTQGRSRQDRHHELRVSLKDLYLYDLKSRKKG
jgi:hypothetical protein